MRTVLATVFLGVAAMGAAGQTIEVTLNQADLAALPGRILIALGLQMPDPASISKKVTSGELPGADRLQSLIDNGTSHGFAGLLYDNRDNGHSRLPTNQFPGLTRLRYGLELQHDGLHYGVAGPIILPATVIGNSSTARTGSLARSQTRFAMTGAGLPEAAFRLFARNHLYIYPEHRDHDDDDRYPANWVHTLTSQGSSGSDMPFVRAVVMTLAAFPSETRAVMDRHGLAASTTQMVLRRHLTHVKGDPDYLSAAAHPSAFSADMLDPDAMIEAAARMSPDVVPPLVRLQVTDETFADGAGLTGGSERLFDTPGAVARVWRGVSHRHTMTVSTGRTRDPTDRPLEFRWVILRGNPDKISIRPRGSGGAEADIIIDWHDPADLVAPAAGSAAARPGNRIDIAVFAWNGHHFSAPAIISVSFPTHQIREYGPDPAGGQRLYSVDYDAIGRDIYYDSVLYASAPWRDHAVYEADGALRGWRRVLRDGTDFAPAGQSVATGDYRVVRRADGRAELERVR